MADMPPRLAAASAFSRLKPEIYKTNDAKVIVEDELLNFLVVKMRTLSHDEIVLLVTSSFTSEWIESAKKALFEVCPDASQCCTTFKGQQKDINNVKLCMKVLNECDVSTLLGRMEQLNSEICCMKRTESNVCESLREVTAAIDGRLTAVEQPLPSVSGPVAAERISDATVQRETTALTPTVAARSSSQTQSPAWTTVVKKAGRSKPAPGNSAVQLRPHLGKTPARSERKKTGIIATGTAGNIKTITTNRLAFIHSFIEDSDSTCYVNGDFNADVSDSNSLFAKHLVHFCNDNNLVLSSKVFLPNNSFTYVNNVQRVCCEKDHAGHERWIETSEEPGQLHKKSQMLFTVTRLG
ncbi:hypothetical protein ABVT39_019381 [Epinephelus coioides]